MPLHNLIFSNKPGKRLQLHLLFWLTWWLYFSFCEYLYQLPLPGKLHPFYLNVGSPLLLKTFLLITVYSIGCYMILYVLLPLVIKKNWLGSVLLLLLVAGSLYLITYLLLWNVFPYLESLLGSSGMTNQGTKFWAALNLGLIAPLKIIASAVIIKYVKNWWLKVKEIERLEREKLNAELRLLKAQVHPGILFTTLNTIYEYSKVASSRAPDLLIKLSDFLSYMLYECEQTFVPLGKEIEMMKGYMALEKSKPGHSFEMELNVLGDMEGKMIAPFLLLPFIEYSFKQASSQSGHSWANMDISIKGDSLHMKLANGMLPGSYSAEDIPANGLANVQKRLALIYPQKHELKISAEQEMLIVHLKIQLDDIANLAGNPYDKPVVEELA